MINNWHPGWVGPGLALAALLLPVGCDNAHASVHEPFQGVVEHEERVLAFEVGGRLTEVPATRGAEVSAGDALAVLDDTLERLAREAREAEVRAAEARLSLLREGARPEEVRAARAELRAARAGEALIARNLERQRRLAAQGAGTSAQVDALEGQQSETTARRQALEQRVRLLSGGARAQEIDAAEAALEAARTGLRASDERLARYTLRAGIDATVLDVHAEPGEVVGPGAPVVTIADVTRPYLDVFVPQQNMDRVHRGGVAHIRVDAFDEELTGEVEDVGRRTEFTPRFLFSERERPNLVMRVRIRVHDPEAKLHAGLPAFVTLDET